MLQLDALRWVLPDGEEIIKDISLTVPDGKLTVVTGPNGGGKTSIAKLIAGLVQPTSGRLLLDGIEITAWDITERAKNGIAYAFQQPVHFKGLTVRDILELAAEQPMDDAELCAVLGKVGLCTREYIDRPVDSSLSGGEIKRIEIASVLARRRARVLLFDEPEAGIDLWSFSSLIETFEALKKERDCALLVISHQERILQIADRVVVIADGRIRIEGDKDSVLPALLAEERRELCPLDNQNGGNA